MENFTYLVSEIYELTKKLVKNTNFVRNLINYIDKKSCPLRH